MPALRATTHHGNQRSSSAARLEIKKRAIASNGLGKPCFFSSSDGAENDATLAVAWRGQTRFQIKRRYKLSSVRTAQPLLETHIMAQNLTPVLRFAPSPTGYLHIGGARTALFNWLYARHTGGKFLLRIEDTDRERSTPEAVAAILNGLSWLGLDWDGEPLFQFARAARHRVVAQQLLARNRAYRCYATPQELEQMRSEQKAKGVSVRYDGRWRDREPGPAQSNLPFVVRLRAPQTGETIVHDIAQGTVRWSNDQLDDMVLLRSDGTPTYMLAVVVDDFDMGVTHVVRGADHLNNAARQLPIIEAMGWPVPVYGHL